MNIEIIEVTPDNIEQTGLLCVKNIKSEGYKAKKEWFLKNYVHGLKILIAEADGKKIGLIEYIPSEYAFRPVKAVDYIFIHCVVVYSKEHRGKQIAAKLLEYCEKDAIESGKHGVCAFVSNGAWIADKTLFIKNGYKSIVGSDRFELVFKKFGKEGNLPEFLNYQDKAIQYSGWNLLYSDQCPWHIKSANDLKTSSENNGIELKIRKINDAAEAQNSPSGFGTFALLNNGKLLEDHYISSTRYCNILKKHK